MHKKLYTTPCLRVVDISTCGILAASGETRNMRWSGDRSGQAGPDQIDDETTLDSF